MRKVLEKAEFKVLVLVGDVYQIESISHLQQPYMVTLHLYRSQKNVQKVYVQILMVGLNLC